MLSSLVKYSLTFFVSTAYENIGCYKDSGNRAIPTLEGKDPILDGGYQARINAIHKCYEAAKRRGYRIFALQDSGWCASSSTAEFTYDKYGTHDACASDGEGGPLANQVYFIRGAYVSLLFGAPIFS